MMPINSYQNSYFYLYQDPSHIPNPYFAVLTPHNQQNNRKYIQLLESQNLLLREKISTLQQKINSYEQMHTQQIVLEVKAKKSNKQKHNYTCPYTNCNRQYKSNLSLNLHIKIKHNGGSVRQRQAYAKLIIECENLNKPKPQIEINFPPKFIEVRGFSIIELPKTTRSKFFANERDIRMEKKVNGT